MNNIIQIKPLFIKKKSSRKYIPNSIDIFQFKQRILMFEKDLVNLYKLDNNKEIAFELIHNDLIPAKTKRINKDLLNYFNWLNLGSRYDIEEGKIILLIVVKKEKLQDNISLIKTLKEILNSEIINNESDLFHTFKIKYNIDQKIFNFLLLFISNLYKKIDLYKGIKLKKDTDYIADVLCNKHLFHNKSNIQFNSSQLKKTESRYLFNVFENNSLSFQYQTFDEHFLNKVEIPNKTNKTIIGILDGFGKIDKNQITKIYINKKNIISSFNHGAFVSSIAIMGDKLNNKDDGCGIFEVMLCVVAYEGIKENELIKNIENAIKENHKQIKIWNISLGTQEIQPFKETSFLGRKLDQLTEKYNVIFVVSGGNDKFTTKNKFLTSPSDSLLSISVNSIDKNNNIASYSRKGVFFLNSFSPTCSAFGGDNNQEVLALDNNQIKRKVTGTSFASPFVCRLLAKLIEIFPNLSLLEILTLFYHSLFLNKKVENNDYFGISIIPKNINEIIKTKSNVTRLIFSGITSNKESECTKLDIPLTKGEFDNNIYMSTISKSIINHAYGVEAVRTSITSKLIAKDKNDIRLDKSDDFLKEVTLIKKEQKWHMISHKKFKKKIRKKFWSPNYEFLEWEIILINENRNSTDFDELKHTKIPFTIIIDIENKSGHNNFQKIFQRLNINNFSPSILVQNDLYLDNILEINKK